MGYKKIAHKHLLEKNNILTWNTCSKVSDDHCADHNKLTVQQITLFLSETDTIDKM